LLGTELYWRDRICAALQEAAGLEAGSFGLSEFDLRQDSLDKVLEKAEAQNLLASRQLLFIKNAQGLLTRRGREAEASLDKAEPRTSRSGDLAAYFHHPNPSSILVLEMMDVDLESDDWREKEKAKSRLEAFEDDFGGRCEVVLLVRPGYGEAMELVRGEAAERGRKITPRAAEQLVAAFHRNMALIRMELEKLCLFDPEKEWIDEEDLNQMIAGAAGEASPALTEAIGSGDASNALQVLDGLKRSGKYPPLIVSEVARFIRQLILLKENKARDARQAGKILWEAKLGVPQSALPGLVEQARKFTAPQLLQGLQLAFEADLALRSSPPDDRLVLERFVLELMRPLNVE
jgi:DNA polymerase-3 subunit delta